MKKIMTPGNPFHAYDAEITLLDGGAAFTAMRTLFTIEAPIYAWIYHLEFSFAAELLALRPDGQETYFIIDHRTRTIAADLAESFKTFNARTWSTNRTMHDKTYVAPAHDAVLLGTHNLTRGAYWSSLNRSALIIHRALTTALLRDWKHDWLHAQSLRKSTLRERKDEH